VSGVAWGGGGGVAVAPRPFGCADMMTVRAVRVCVGGRRIDGRTPPHRKHEYKNAFQENPQVQVALVGLTAAGVGLTFTAAHTALFAELNWTPVSEPGVSMRSVMPSRGEGGADCVLEFPHRRNTTRPPARRATWPRRKTAFTASGNAPLSAT